MERRCEKQDENDENDENVLHEDEKKDDSHFARGAIQKSSLNMMHRQLMYPLAQKRKAWHIYGKDFILLYYFVVIHRYILQCLIP